MEKRAMLCPCSSLVCMDRQITVVICFLTKLSTAMFSSGRMCRQYGCGDFNDDISRCDDSYPWPEVAARGTALDKLKQLKGFCKGTKMQICKPNHDRVPPVCRFRQECSEFPFSWIPTGEQDERMYPSLIDFAIKD
eukprot:9244445-Karenia_brevis.AAC.1